MITLPCLAADPRGDLTPNQHSLQFFRDLPTIWPGGEGRPMLHTPLSMIQEDNGTCICFFTAGDKNNPPYWGVGMVKLKLVKDAPAIAPAQ